MARSRQKTPIFGHTTAASEKRDKRKANRALRAQVRVALAADTEVLPILREISDLWSFAKDGKSYLPGRPDMMRK